VSAVVNIVLVNVDIAFFEVSAVADIVLVSVEIAFCEVTEMLNFAACVVDPNTKIVIN
jgi:hypothetical protein